MAFIIKYASSRSSINACLKFGRGILMLCFAFASIISRGQTPYEYQVKAVFIYNFLHFVEWPPESLGEPGDPFIVAVVGDNVFGTSLAEVLKDETIKGHPVILKHGANIEEVGKSHMLFLSPSYVETNAKDIQKLSGEPVLTVSDSEDFMDYGVVRFFKQNEKIKLEINQEAATNAGLVISSKLLRLADIHKK
ncbi:MAG TPA: YfiR family protein [Chryseosolibacter sp.]|nr:YfiR family protein [Chryseosolibacter sp.]